MVLQFKINFNKQMLMKVLKFVVEWQH